MGRRRGLRGSAMTALLASILLLFSALSVLPAQAEDGSVELTIAQVSPMVLGTSGDLVISGTARNTGNTSIPDVHVQLWRDATGLRTPSAIDRSERGQSGGGDLSYAPGATFGLGDLGPGEIRSFEVRASLDPTQATEPLWLEQPDAAYRVGVQARSGSNATLLGASGFLMAHPGPRARTQAAVIVELSSAPSRVVRPDGTWTIPDYRLLDELAGRIGKLLIQAEQSKANVVIDPMLYDEIALLESSAQVAGQPLSPAQLELAKSSLIQLQRLIDSGRAYRSLYGTPDIEAVLLAPDRKEGLRLLATLPGAHKMATLPLFVSPQDGIGDKLLTKSLAELNVPVTLAVTNLDCGSATRCTVDGIDALVVPAASHGSQVAHRSQALAELLVAGLTGSPVAVVVNDPSQLADWQSYDWIRQVDLATLAAGAESDYWQAEPNRIPNDGRPGQAQHALSLATTWASLTGKDDQLESIQQSLFGGIWSLQWPSEDARKAWFAAATSPLRSYADPAALRLRVPNSVTTSADDNVLPVTIVSSLDVPVTVKVHFESANAQRISIPDSEPFQVRPGESTTIRVRPHSQANGTVAITAQLVTSNDQPIGTPVEFTVQATQAGRVGWVIIVVSSIVLLTTTAWRVRQVRAKQRR